MGRTCTRRHHVIVKTGLDLDATSTQKVETVSEYSISEAAAKLGVTTRTLRYWDSIGLLSPQWRTYSDYRIYTEADFRRALKILVYRSVGVPLASIKDILDDAAMAPHVLKQQRQKLLEEAAHLQRMVRAVDELLEDTMSNEDIIATYGELWENYADEAEQRWGDTVEWEQSQQRTAGRSKQDWAQIMRAHEVFVDALIEAENAGVKPGSEAAAELVAEHARQIEQYYDCTLEKQVCLARVYVADERFSRSYRGAAPYLLRLIEGEAEKAGLDLEEISWG